jgi:hypothetical protein
LDNRIFCCFIDNDYNCLSGKRFIFKSTQNWKYFTRRPGLLILRTKNYYVGFDIYLGLFSEILEPQEITTNHHQPVNLCLEILKAGLLFFYLLGNSRRSGLYIFISVEYFFLYPFAVLKILIFQYNYNVDRI